jgi:hypothetical protein
MNDQYTVFVGDDGWWVVGVHESEARASPIAPAAPEDAAIESRAGAIRQQLADWGYADQPIVLALPSSWCLCATISTDDLARGRRRRAMAFRLEEHLPISAEEMVADYFSTVRGEALGVCGELVKLRTITGALEAGGIRVRHICPAAFLAAAYAADQRGKIDGVLIYGIGGEGRRSAAGYDLVELREGKPIRWWWLAQDEAALRDRLAAWAAEHERPMQLAVIGSGPTPQWHQGCEGIELVELGGISHDQAAAHHAAKILEGDVSPWIDFRRDALAQRDPHGVYRKPIRALVAAVAFLLICVSGIMQWRGWRYEALSRNYGEQQVEVFKSALPNQHVSPSVVKGRLLSERQRLEGLSGQAAEDASEEALRAVSALVHLREVLSRLPADLHYRILDLTIQPDLIRVAGQARSHAEAEKVVIGLRQSGKYEVDSPRTQALKESGVSFSFAAKPCTDSATMRKGGPE